ncbi:MAG: hypothetical protein ACXQS8_03985 [Candidatus Helarchaeales archaeon]
MIPVEELNYDPNTGDQFGTFIFTMWLLFFFPFNIKPGMMLWTMLFFSRDLILMITLNIVGILVPPLIGTMIFFIANVLVSRKSAEKNRVKKSSIFCATTITHFMSWSFFYDFFPTTHIELVIWLISLFLFYVHDGREAFPAFRAYQRMTRVDALKKNADVDDMKWVQANMSALYLMITYMLITRCWNIYPFFLFFIFYSRYLFFRWSKDIQTREVFLARYKVTWDSFSLEEKNVLFFFIPSIIGAIALLFSTIALIFLHPEALNNVFWI